MINTIDGNSGNYSDGYGRGNVLSAPNVVNAIAMEALKTLMCA